MSDFFSRERFLENTSSKVYLLKSFKDTVVSLSEILYLRDSITVFFSNLRQQPKLQKTEQLSTDCLPRKQRLPQALVCSHVGV